MSCRDFHDLLDAWLSGLRSSEGFAAMDAHAAACASCRDAFVPVLDALDVPPVDAPSDLAASVLARTTGSGCGRAQELLPALIGEIPAGVDAQLLDLHLERCGACAAISLALARLAVDLPALAHVRPDSRFPHDVLRRTTRTRARRLEALLGRAPWLWQRLILRPRFAAEGAYVGSLLLVGVVSLGGATVADVSRGAAFAAATNPVRAAKGPVERLGSGALEAAREMASQAEAIASPARNSFERSWREAATSFRHAARRIVTSLGGQDEPPNSNAQPHHEGT